MPDVRWRPKAALTRLVDSSRVLPAWTSSPRRRSTGRPSCRHSPSRPRPRLRHPRRRPLRLRLRRALAPTHPGLLRHLVRVLAVGLPTSRCFSHAQTTPPLRGRYRRQWLPRHRHLRRRPTSHALPRLRPRTILVARLCGHHDPNIPKQSIVHPAIAPTADNPRHHLTPACSGLVSLAADARR